MWALRYSENSDAVENREGLTGLLRRVKTYDPHLARVGRAPFCATGYIESDPTPQDTASRSGTRLDAMRRAIRRISEIYGGRLDSMPLFRCAGDGYALRYCRLGQLLRSVLDGPENPLNTG